MSRALQRMTGLVRIGKGAMHAFGMLIIRRVKFDAGVVQ